MPRLVLLVKRIKFFQLGEANSIFTHQFFDFSQLFFSVCFHNYSYLSILVKIIYHSCVKLYQKNDIVNNTFSKKKESVRSLLEKVLSGNYFKYQSTVLTMPVSKFSSAFQPSSLLNFEASMA